jgi:hypothetical protein
MEAVLATLQDNYVRPDEDNAAQSRVATKGKHCFIDKVHVRYVEKEKRHWATLENFNSQRIAIGERFYRDNDRLLEGGIWAEVTVAHNDIEDDDYAFAIEELRPIQLTRFDFERYARGRAAFGSDEWLDVLMRSRWAWNRLRGLEAEPAGTGRGSGRQAERQTAQSGDSGWVIKIGRGLDFAAFRCSATTPPVPRDGVPPPPARAGRLSDAIRDRPATGPRRSPGPPRR